jgi:hypothetical protein
MRSVVSPDAGAAPASYRRAEAQPRALATDRTEIEMTADATDLRSRRALLAGALGAAVATVASAIGRPVPASAATGDEVLAGKTTESTGPTILRAPGPVLVVQSTAAHTSSTLSGNATGTTGSATGVSGQGSGPHDRGVAGTAGSNTGKNFGVYGRSASPDGAGVMGQSSGGTGVVGSSSDAFDVASPQRRTGVYGYGPFDKTSKGVWGRANAGRGVMGEATSGVGVYAVAGTGGTALYVAGPAGFSRSGLVGVPAGASSYTKTGIALKSGSLVLAVVNQDVAGVWVQRVVPNVAGSSFTIHLNKTAPVTTRVAYFVIG